MPPLPSSSNSSGWEGWDGDEHSASDPPLSLLLLSPLFGPDRFNFAPLACLLFPDDFTPLPLLLLPLCDSFTDFPNALPLPLPGPVPLPPLPLPLEDFPLPLLLLLLLLQLLLLLLLLLLLPEGPPCSREGCMVLGLRTPDGFKMRPLRPAPCMNTMPFARLASMNLVYLPPSCRRNRRNWSL